MTATKSVPKAPARLSEDILPVLDALATGAPRLREIFEITHGRGYLLTLFLLSLPFCVPIPLPGLSTPLGLIIALIGGRLAFDDRPWLPDRLLDKHLPQAMFSGLLAFGTRVVRALEILLLPRLSWLVEVKALRRGWCVLIVVSGLLLALPLPVPLSNFFPALTIVVLAGALLERDGCAALVGMGLFVATAFFFGMIYWGGTEVMNWLHHQMLTQIHQSAALP